MWSVIIASIATIGVVLYMQGPIVALTLTALGSMALLIALRIRDCKTQTPARKPRALSAIDAGADADLMFPPLREHAS